MLFNSYSFLLGFLPVTAIGFFWLAGISHRLAATWLAIASVFFYGWWNPAYVALLGLSIVYNYAFGILISRAFSEGNAVRRRLFLIVAVAGNLLLLGYYKYANFFIQTANEISGTQWGLGEILLPLGISFFTFTQIAFLADAYKGKAKEYDFIHYLLFVTYFPHLIAGPVLHHKEMMPQFAQPETYRLSYENLAVGMTIFSIGLFKKTILADGIAVYASPVFSASEAGTPLTFFESWGGVLAYTLQLYFDFSGYSDMAIGLSRLFGIVLPLNFDSPYKAVNIIDFWRRWHMTLSRFLRDYLYIALGGNRKGTVRRYANLGITMVLGGLWHGAGWTFVIWGALHGTYLVANHAWHGLRRALGHDLSESSAFGRAIARMVTLLAVIVGWVFFRSSSTDGALRMLGAMTGANGIAIPEAIARSIGPIHQWLERAGVEVYLGGGSQFALTYLWVGTLLTIALFAPNTQELMRKFRPGLHVGSLSTAGFSERAAREALGEPRILEWRPTRFWSLAIAIALACGLLSLTRISEFLYFQF